MYNIVRCLLLIILLTTALTKVAAQTFSVSPTQIEVGVGQTFQIRYLLENGSLNDFQTPTFSNFVVVGGPNKSQSMQFINGSVSSSLSISYILKAKTEGTFIIPPAVATVNKKTLRTQKINITVSKSAKKNTPTPQQKPGGISNIPTPPPASAPNTAINADNLDDLVFLKLELDTTKVYQEQQVTAVYTLYTAVEISDYNITDLPPLTGFWVQDMTPQNLSTGGKRTTINNKEFVAYELKKYALFPQTTGNLQLQEMNLNVEVRIPEDDPNFNGFFFRPYKTLQLQLKSKPATIQVMPLPDADKPSNFSGIVGNYNLLVNINKNTVKQNESITLTATVSGAGDIKLIQPPTLQLPPELESFDPQVVEKIYIENDTIKGHKVFTYTIVPSTIGQYTVPALSFSYFNPKNKQYNTLQAQPFTIVVQQGNGGINTAKKDKDNLLRELKDINNLKSTATKPFISTIWFWILWLLPVLGLPIAYKYQDKRKAKLADVVGTKRKQANKVAIQRLLKANALLKSNQQRDFYNEVIHAIWNYISQKLNVPLSELSKSNISQVLTNHNVSSTHINKLLQTITYCEMALFAPLSQQLSMQSVYQNATEVISNIEEELVLQQNIKV